MPRTLTYDDVLTGRTPPGAVDLWVAFDSCTWTGGPRRVEHWYEDHVLVEGSHSDDERWARAIPCDVTGATLLVIPRSCVMAIYTKEEAEQIEIMLDIDQNMLAAAR